ncbi:MAG: orotidine 5'-phosphate decarboxylase [Chloroflexi bacterium RBG_13_53_26]|jgi:orotidine-5'-phosphate decarboxylase|nr:MAG: orotidine 5'-phosphate decarboxylase [Chloroflexi bacterium RBG_13_53_26]
MDFAEKLLQAVRRNNSRLCLGLDPDPEFMPKTSIIEFNKAIINSTSDLVCAYKPNLAFYEALGSEGLPALQETIKYIPENIPIIGDAKRGDVGHTARAYAKALFEVLGFDAATVNPYLGYDSIEPFISYIDKATFILCRTSNPGAGDFQDVACSTEQAENRHQPLYWLVARKAKEWNERNNIGLVVGATYPQELQEIRQLCPEMDLLIPGIGAQGGNLEWAVRYGMDAKGERAIFSSSRQILYASKDSDFAQAARRVADEVRRQINSLL